MSLAAILLEEERLLAGPCVASCIGREVASAMDLIVSRRSGRFRTLGEADDPIPPL
jgi:hypothetical protein